MIDLAFLRIRPFDAVRTTGFVVQATDEDYYLSGRCNVTCRPLLNNNNLVTLNIHLTDEGRDWYCGYEEHEVKSLLVPFGQPDGTLILTYPMNGCALEVRREKEGNRIYHDHNGVCMPRSIDGTRALRVSANHYMDWGNRHFVRTERLAYRAGLTRKYSGFSFAHTIICIKQGRNWNVYNNAVSQIYELDPFSAQRINQEYFQPKDYIKYSLGYFPD
ncbi:hypothetical protein V5J34_000263 [Endozoicomonas sp. NE35]